MRKTSIQDLSNNHFFPMTLMLEYRSGELHEILRGKIDSILNENLSVQSQLVPEPSKSLALQNPITDADLEMWKNGSLNPPKRRIAVDQYIKASLANLSQNKDLTKIHELNQFVFLHRFEAYAKYYPDYPAILFKNQIWTYTQVNSRANEIANFLLKRKEAAELDTSKEFVIGTFLPREPEWIIAILAIWKAGAAFIAIDPTAIGNSPDAIDDYFEKFSQILSDAKPAFILTHSDHQYLLPKSEASGFSCLCLDECEEEIDKWSDGNLDIKIDPEDLAYILYTSGSTGKPKGVEIAHRGFMPCLEAHRECVDLTRDSIMAQYATCDFDAWVAEMLILGIGGTLAIVPSDIRLDETRCARYYQEHKISVAIFTPAFLNKLGGPENFPLWRALFIVGESFDWELVKKWKTEKLQIVNGYGLTETTICATLENLDMEDVGKPLSIGRPILGTKILIKIPTNIDINNPDIEKDYGPETTYQDPEYSSSAIDLAGEPWFGGISLTRGYRSEAMQNNAWRFVEIEGERYYKSGDKAILRADGRLEHQGRYSRMVKISGKRIELPSIEANLCQHFQLEKMAIAVTAVGNSLDDKNLTTILVFLKENEQKKIDLEEIRSFIINNEKNIDKQMPLHILSKKEFPTTQTKINLAELNKSYFESHTKKLTIDSTIDYKFSSKENNIFKKLKDCWTGVISTEDLRPEDDFFLLGGRSIDISPLIQLLRLAFPEIKEEINNNLVIECKTLLSQTKRLYTLLHPIELIPLKKKQKAEAPYIIFCPPSILGDPEQDFSELLAQSDTDFKKPIFDDRFQIYGLKARGLSDPSMMPTSLYSMAQDYALTIKAWLEKEGKEDRPVFILGWSSGGTLTPEIVNSLEKYDVQAYAYVCDSIAPFPFHHFNHEEHTQELILLAGKLCQAIGLKIETQDLKSELRKIKKPRDRIIYCFDYLIQRAKINHRNMLNTAKVIRLAEHNYIIRDGIPSIRLYKAKHYLLDGLLPKDSVHYWPKNCIHRLDEIEDNIIEGNHFEMIQQLSLAQKITSQIIQDFTYHKLKKLKKILKKQANYVVPFIEIIAPNASEEEEENRPDILFSDAIADLLADPEKIVVLLQGESGLGKSIGTLQLEKSLQAINVLSKTIILNRYTCEELKKSIREELREWEKVSIEIRVLILEGYDERRGTLDFNYYDSNGLSDYQNLKVIFTCRSETLRPGYLTNFIPGEREALAEMKLQPFTEDQIKALMDIRLNKKKSNIKKIEINKLYEEISSRHELLELVKNPLLLTFVLKSLPTLIKSTATLTRFKIYEAFNQDYFERGELKIKSQSGIEDDQDFRMDCRLHCQRVALTFFSEGLTSYEVKKNKNKSLLNIKKKNSTIIDDLFNKDKKQILKASPIKNNNNVYQFNHKTEIDFFVVDALISIFKEQDADFDDFQSWFIDNKLTPDKLVSNESIIKFWDDGYKQDPFLKAILFKIIDATRDSVNLEKIGGIAITLLNMASENFNGANLKRIRVPGANLIGGYFDCTDFTGSDLKLVKLDRAWLRNAKLINCQLNEVSFGEYPYFEHEDAIKSMVYRPDINVLATLTGTTVYIWDIVKGQIIQELKNENAKSVHSMHMSGNGQKLALALENTIKVYDLASGKSSILKGHEKTVWSVFLSENGETVASGSADKTIRVWHVLNKRKPVILRGHKKIISKIHMSNDGLRVISGSYMNDDRSTDDTVRVWDVETRKSIVLEANHHGGRCVYLSGDGRTAVTVTFDHTVLIWNAQTGENINILQGHKSFVRAVDLSVNGKTLASCSDDYTIRVWDVPTGESKVLRGYELSPGNVQFSKDELTVASTDGHIVRIWDISSARPEVLRSHKGCVGYVHLSGGGQMVASMSGDVLIEDNKVRLHDLVSGQSIVLVKHKHSRNLPVYLSKDGRIVATSVRKNSVGVWDVESRQLLLSADHGASLSALHLSRDGKTVATGGGSKFEIPDYSVRVWNVASGQAVVLEGHENEIRYVYLSADGRTVASASNDKTVRIWDVARRQALVLQIENHICDICLSENGKKMAIITSRDENDERVYTISVRNLPDGKEISLVSRNERIEILQLSNDGKAVIACLRKNKRLNIWDMNSQKNLGLILFNSEVNAISIDDSLSILVVGLKDSTVQIWDRQSNQSSQWNLRWSSNYPNLSLHLAECDFTGSQGLTAQNERLLIQGGATNSAKAEKLNSIEAWNKFSVITTANTNKTKKEPSDDEDFSPNIDQINTLDMN